MQTVGVVRKADFIPSLQSFIKTYLYVMYLYNIPGNPTPVTRAWMTYRLYYWVCCEVPPPGSGQNMHFSSWRKPSEAFHFVKWRSQEIDSLPSVLSSSQVKIPRETVQSIIFIDVGNSKMLLSRVYYRNRFQDFAVARK